ncbi:MAG: sulfatase [Vicinamibacteria bacterium]|nr:sulfatase [Vicinamibacteria bacterium]
MRFESVVFAMAALVSACGRVPVSSHPYSLLEQGAANGAMARTARMTSGAETRPVLLASTAWDVTLPARPLLTFAAGVSHALSAEPPGWFHLDIRLDDHVIFRRRFNPRAMRGFRDFSVELPRNRRMRSHLAFDVRLADREGRTISQPSALLLGVAEPTIHDLNDYGRRKGVVVVSIDTLRRDHVGTHGYARPTTPHLDELARKSIVCEDAVSPSSWTLPAHLSLLTSVDPAAHGGVDMRHGFNGRVPTLPGLLQAAGFATQAITSHLYVSAVYGLDAGFDHMDFIQDRRATGVVNRAISTLDRFGDRPFFLLLHFYDPHWHYDPPEPQRRIFARPYAGVFTGFWNDFKSHDRSNTSEADLAHLIDLYDGEIRYVDDEMARMSAHMRRRGLDRGTLLIVTSDHGEEFLEHGGWEHQRTLYEEVIRVPLFVSGPGVVPRTEPNQASLLDVAPTVLEWAGVAVPETMRGRSLLRPLPKRDAYGETQHTDDGTNKLFLRNGQESEKLILSLDRADHSIRSEERFALASDPDEQEPARPESSIADTMRDRALERFRSGRASPSSGGPAVCLRAEQREKLRLLGYIASSDSSACPE